MSTQPQHNAHVCIQLGLTAPSSVAVGDFTLTARPHNN